MSDEPLVEREWTYIGREFWPRDGIKHGWLCDDGQTRWWKRGPRDLIVGGVFTVETTEDRSTMVTNRASYVRPSEHDDIDKWRLTDRRAYVEQQAAAERKRLAKDRDFGDLTLREVRSLMWDRGTSHRGPTLAVVLSYLEME